MAFVAFNLGEGGGLENERDRGVPGASGGSGGDGSGGRGGEFLFVIVIALGKLF